MYPNEKRLVQYINEITKNGNGIHDEDMSKLFNWDSYPILTIHIVLSSKLPSLFPVFYKATSLCDFKLTCDPRLPLVTPVVAVNTAIARDLSSSLGICQCLMKLCLSGIGITDEYLLELKPGLDKCFQLVELDLSHNDISDCRPLSTLLNGGDFCLSLLDLSYNNIRVFSCEYIEDLNISMNPLGNKGCIFLWNIPGLRVLKIQSVLLTALPDLSTSSLMELDISGNDACAGTPILPPGLVLKTNQTCSNTKHHILRSINS